MPQSPSAISEKLCLEALKERLLAVGAERYHDKHPFHIRMHEGLLSEDEVRAWIINRFYYQASLPIKDSIVLGKLPSRRDRRLWMQRIIDHDGLPLLDDDATTMSQDSGGGIDAWVELGRAAGIDSDDLISQRFVAPGTRFAVDGYINFCRNNSWLEAVASSLTELFAPVLIKNRLSVFSRHYPWIERAGLAYFERRLEQAPRDSQHALSLVLQHAETRNMQESVIASVRYKCDVLWCILDATEHSGSGHKSLDRGFK